jgi:hypothetical protein
VSVIIIPRAERERDGEIERESVCVVITIEFSSFDWYLQCPFFSSTN